MSSKATSSRYLLWSGPAKLQFGQSSAELACRVYQQANKRAELVIEGEDRSGALPFYFSQGTVQLIIPNAQNPINVLVTEHSWNSSGSSSVALLPSQTPCWLSSNRPIRSGRLLIINFSQCWMGSPNELGFTLKLSGWIAKFIPVTDKHLTIPNLESNEDYRITYQVELSREDGSIYKETEVQDFLWKLSLFLSFCQGQWVGYSLMVGLDENGEMALQQWGTGRLSTWRSPSGWLDEHHGKCISELSDKFFSRLKIEGWLEAINHVIYWFARAHTDLVGPDGACILLQAALERLSWHVLVRERRAISEKGFRDLAASDQLRLMLNILSIPTEIPEGLSDLLRLGKSKSMDGPEIFTYIRNRLTHPPKLSAIREHLPYYEAYCLAQWYVELSILSACGYCGEYANRTTMMRFVGLVEKVPWAETCQ